MAIKRTKTPEAAKKSLPEKLALFCNKAFTFDAFAKFFEAQAKEGKDGIKAYLESNADGFELDLTVAKSFDCEEGKVTFATRKRFDYDADKLIDLIKNGTVNIETVINCISTFKDKDLQTALGSKFDLIATEGYTEFLQLKATEAFKAKVAKICGEKVPEAPEADQEAVAVVERSVEKTVEKPASKALSLDDILSGKI